MLLFYDKKTGLIVGTIEGRLHSKSHLEMWVGEKKDTERIIINWKPTREKIEIVESKVFVEYKKDKDGYDIPIYKKIKQKIKTSEFEPDHLQKQLFIDFETGKERVYDYKVDVNTKQLIKK